MGLEVFVPNDIKFRDFSKSDAFVNWRVWDISICSVLPEINSDASGVKAPPPPTSPPTPASESYYGPRNKGVHPPGDVNISSLPLLQIITEWVIQFSCGPALPVANLFTITSEERLVKLTRHTESAGRRQSEATSNNHSCMVVNKELGKLCPPAADHHTANKC